MPGGELKEGGPGCQLWPSAKELAVAWVAAGFSATEVAPVFGVSHGTVSRWASAAGFGRRRTTLEDLAANPGHAMHGKITGYHLGCRCRRCRNAQKVNSKKAQIRRVLRGKEPW